MVLMLVSVSLLEAQTTHRATPRNIFEALEGEVSGEGSVVVVQSQALKELVGGVSARYRGILGKEGNTTLLHGYRIQVYNGNLSSSKSEAERRAAQVRRLAPEYRPYITYNAPFWRLVVGDFISQDQARSARAKLAKVLPTWFHESYIVKDKVRIINYNPDANE